MALSLEALPLELLAHILRSIPDLETLQSAILSCSTVYHAYLFDRHQILLEFILQQHGDHVNLAEAIAAIRSEGLCAAEPSNREKIIAILDCRRRSDEIQKLASAHTLLPHLPVNIEEILQLLQLRKEANFFLQDYAANIQCPRWMDPVKWSSDILPIMLSITERKRLLRAYYRLQTYHNIFGAPEYQSGDKSMKLRQNRWQDEGFSVEEVWRLFFSSMPLWEVEELASTWAYLFKRYVPIIQEISDDLTSYGKGFAGKLGVDIPSPSIVVETTDLCGDQTQYQEGMASLGPKFLYKILRGTYQERRDLILVNYGTFPTSFDFVLRTFPLDISSRLLYPADKYDRDDLESVLPKLPPLEQPNLAWTRYWFGEDPVYTVYFMEMPLCFNYDHGRWDWGYAIWDTERLLEWQAPLEESPMLSEDDGSSNDHADGNTANYSSPSS